MYMGEIKSWLFDNLSKLLLFQTWMIYTQV